MSIEQCRQYFEAMTISETALVQALYELMDAHHPDASP
jgi:hypothetical protein